MRIATICMSAVFLAGCATIDRVPGDMCAPDGRDAVPVEAVQVMNTNWMLLSFLPIASGDVRRPNECTCRWFRNTVGLPGQMKMLEDEMRLAGATRAVNVATAYSTERVLFFLLLREKIRTSAVLVKDVFR